MQTTTGLVAYLQRRFGLGGSPLLLVLLIALAVATVIATLAATGLLTAAAEPVLVAPVRWGNRYL